MATESNPRFFPGEILSEPPKVVVISPPARRYWLHLLLFGTTIFTTLVVGARLQYNFVNNHAAFATDADFFPLRWVLQSPSRLGMGIPFSATLLGILLMHEMGHFILCVRNRVYVTLPFFIPAPTLIGTLGAFIRIKSPIRSRAALFDIGIAGPIAGFVVALPILFIALLSSRPLPANAAESAVQFGYPLIFVLAHWGMAHLAMAGATGSGGIASLSLEQIYLHPTAVAAWVGMFATTLNLLPGGQLDGGHIIFALWPRLHRRISAVNVVILFVLGLVFWPGWIIWGLLLAITGMRHPAVPAWPPLDGKRRMLALIALTMFVLTFMLNPFPGYSVFDLIHQRLESR